MTFILELKEFLEYLRREEGEKDQWFERPFYLSSPGVEASWHDSAKGDESLLTSSPLLGSLFGKGENFSPSSLSEIESLGKLEASLLSNPSGEERPEEKGKKEILPEFCQAYMLRWGGMGVIYFAYDHRKNRPLVVKTIRPDRLAGKGKLLEQFCRECHIWLDLPSHPRIVEAYRLEIYEGLPFLFLEFFPSMSAEKKGGLYSPSEIVKIAYQVTSALGDIQRSRPGFSHGDIKPGNILICDEVAKVTDMGLASLAGSEGEWSEGEIVGTPLYMSPQQWETGQGSEKDDLYSLGATLYHMISGHPPFLSQDLEELYFRHRDEAPPPLPQKEEHPPEILELIESCLAKEPGGRPVSFEEVREILADLIKREEGGSYLWKDRFSRWWHRGKDLLPNLSGSADKQMEKGLEEMLRQVSEKEVWSDRDWQKLRHLSQIVLEKDLAGKLDISFEKTNFSPRHLQREDLTNLYLPGGNFSRKNLSGRDLSGSYLAGADFSSANLEGIQLDQTNLEGARLDRTNLKGARLRSYLARSEMEGADFRRAEIALLGDGEEIFKTMEVKRCNFQGASVNCEGPTSFPLAAFDYYSWTPAAWKRAALLSYQYSSSRSEKEEGEFSLSDWKKVTLADLASGEADPLFLLVLDWVKGEEDQTLEPLIDSVREATEKGWELLIEGELPWEREILTTYLEKGLLALGEISRRSSSLGEKAKNLARDLASQQMELAFEHPEIFAGDKEKMKALMSRARNHPDEEIRRRAEEWWQKS